MPWKTCFKCNECKDLNEFYKHSQMADGHLNKCKQCTKKDSIKNRNENIDYYVEYDRKRANLPHRVEARKLYAQTEEGKEAIKRAHKKYIKMRPQIREAHILTGNAIAQKKLIKQPCEICGELEVHAHHDNYNEPLNVRWLCIPHHIKWHKENTPIY